MLAGNTAEFPVLTFHGREDEVERKRVISFEFKRMDHIIVRQLRKRLADAGFDEMTIMHGHILGYLYHSQERAVYQRDIANHFEIGKSSVTNILQLMEKKGYLTCTTDRNDARLKRIELTDKGRETHLQTIKVIDKLHEDMEEGITEEEQEVFFRVIEKMKENVCKMNKEEET